MEFPENFWWGVSSSGFQFEMGDAHRENIDPNTDWFVWVHDSYNIRKGIVSGDIPEDGVDYWTRYKQDHDLAKEMGLNAYRLGIEWSRIFPSPTLDIELDIKYSNDGYIEKISFDDEAIEELDKLANEYAIKKYRDIIMDLHSKGFKVIICLNHFTLPIWIHNPIEARKNRLKRGRLGWLDKHTIVEFTKYCGYIAYRFGDIVDYWATFNEPMIVAEAGYLKYEGFPPHYNDMGFPPSLVRSAFVRAVFNIINAHARAYDAIKYFDKEYAGDSDSPCSVGLIHNVEPIYPLRPDNDNDINASNFIDHMHNHLFIEAVRNGWLDENLDRKKSGSEIKHFLGNRLDWIGINYYNRFVIKGKLGFIARKLAKIPAFFELVDGYGYLGGMRRNLIQKLFGWEPKKIVTYVSRDGYPVSEFGWELYPEGIAICIDLMKKYDLPLFITENGVADSMDILRPWFIASHLKVLSQKLGEKGLDLRGYFHWALTDNYEWARGFKMRFGLYHVNLRTKERTPRKSVSIYKEIIINRKVTREVESKVKPQIKDKD